MASKKDEKMKRAGIGRPRKYEKAATLRAAIERYFDSISRPVEMTNLNGDVIRNDDGEPYTMVEYLRPPTVSGLCLFLGIDRSTWNNYCDPKLHPEFWEVTAQTRARIEAYLEEELLTRPGKDARGIIFNLQNNYDWRQKQEVELGAETRKTTSVAAMSLEEKMAIIAKAQQNYTAGDADEGG